MLKTHNDILHAMITRMDACRDAGIDLISPEAKAWYAADAETQNLKRLLTVYRAAQDEAANRCLVGVGRITFAERALCAAQLPDDPRAHFVAGV
jgi:hypothetical protein